MADEELARIAYEEYMRDCRLREDQGALLQQHWIAAASAVVQAMQSNGVQFTEEAQ